MCNRLDLCDSYFVWGKILDDIGLQHSMVNTYMYRKTATSRTSIHTLAVHRSKRKKAHTYM